MDKNIVMIILVVGLLVLGGVQAIQINSLKEGYNNEVNTIPNQNTQQTTGYQPSGPSSAPAMVGGC